MTAQTRERIEAVEQGLLPAVLLRGQRPRMSLTDRMAHHRVPGVSVAVIDDGRIEWAKGYGALEANGAVPVTPETLFQACSISKPVTAAAVLTLVERGLVDLDTDVNTCLTSWKLPDNELTRETPVTLRRLLSHRAGTTVHGFPGYPMGSPLPTLAQVLDGVAPANTAPVRVGKIPGAQFQYSGGGTMIVQQLIEETTGRRFADFVRETVLEPLEMRDSTHEQPLPGPLHARAACGHHGDGGGVPGRWYVYPELAAAGLWTTPSDLCRFAVELQLAAAGRSARVLSQDIVRQMLTVQGDGPTGLGPFVNGSGPSARFGHSGANEGFRCELVAYIDGGQGAAVMTNSDRGEPLALEVLNAIADVYGWPEYLVEKTVVTLDPAINDRYVGHYEVSPQLTITVRRDRDGLLAEAPGFGEGQMYPESETDFFLVDLPVQMSFVVDDKGRVSGAVVRAFGTELMAERTAS